jgi:predicted metalloprotease with PDZ domain
MDLVAVAHEHVLHRNSEGSFGIAIVSADNADAGQQIGQIMPSALEATNGGLAIGHHLLTVGGVDVATADNETVTELFNQAGDTLEIVTAPAGANRLVNPGSISMMEVHTREVVLHRPSPDQPWGVQMTTLPEIAGNFVRMVTAGSAAEAAGVAAGDHILAVDGESVLTADMDVLTAALAGGRTKVALHVCNARFMPYATHFVFPRAADGTTGMVLTGGDPGEHMCDDCVVNATPGSEVGACPHPATSDGSYLPLFWLDGWPPRQIAHPIIAVG